MWPACMAVPPALRTGMRARCCRPQNLPVSLLGRPSAAGTKGKTQMCRACRKAQACNAGRAARYWGGVRAIPLPPPAGQPQVKGRALGEVARAARAATGSRQGHSLCNRVSGYLGT